MKIILLTIKVLGTMCRGTMGTVPATALGLEPNLLVPPLLPLQIAGNCYKTFLGGLI